MRRKYRHMQILRLYADKVLAIISTTTPTPIIATSYINQESPF